jgi:hypothetical protein
MREWMRWGMTGAVVLSVAVTSTGCKKLKEQAMEQATKAAAEQTGTQDSGGFFLDASPIPTKFSAKVGGSAHFLELTVYPGYAIAQIQDPKKHENVDQYELRGGDVSNEGPVKFVGEQPTAKDLDFTCVDGATLDWTAVPKMVTDAPARLKIEEGKVSHAIFKRNLPFSKDAVWRVYVSGPRKDGSVEYDTKGVMRKVY